MENKEMTLEEAIAALADLYDQSPEALNKAIKSIGKGMASGKASGKIELNHKNGNRSTVIRYTKGELNGTMETYHENGLLAELQQYRLGDRHGLFIRCTEDGEVVQVLTYNQNKLDGPCFRKQPRTGNIHLDILCNGTMKKDECRTLKKDTDQVMYNWVLRMMQSMGNAILRDVYSGE
jgi:hypothetical protein